MNILSLQTFSIFHGESYPFKYIHIYDKGVHPYCVSVPSLTNTMTAVSSQGASPECAGAARVHWHPGALVLQFSCSSPSAPVWPAAPQSQPAAGWLCAPPWPVAPSGPPGHAEHHPGAAGCPVNKKTLKVLKSLSASQGMNWKKVWCQKQEVTCLSLE